LALLFQIEEYLGVFNNSISGAVRCTYKDCGIRKRITFSLEVLKHFVFFSFWTSDILASVCLYNNIKICIGYVMSNEELLHNYEE